MPDTLKLSWSRIRTHSECPAKGGLLSAGHKSPVSDRRMFFPGTVADRCMRQWLNLDDPPRGWMVKEVDRIMDEEEKTSKETGDGIIKWKSATDRKEVAELCKAATHQLEDDLRCLLNMNGTFPGGAYDWDPAPRFEVPITIPYKDDRVRILLHGEIDLLVRRPAIPNQKSYEGAFSWLNAGIEVWDLKTTKDSSYWRKSLGQLVFYEIAMFIQKKEWPVRSGILQPLCQETTPYWPFTMDHRTQMLQRIVQVAGEILEGRLDPKPEKSKCTYCEVRHACPVKGGGRGRVQAFGGSRLWMRVCHLTWTTT